MLVELAGVLRYPRLQARYGLSEEEIYTYVQFLQEVSEMVTVDRQMLVSMRDPKDIVILQTAVTGDADIICTLDADFYADETKTYCETLGIEICTDSKLLARLKSKP
jgi:putative PIN family toxin of toxin-antitoxin system